MMFLLFCYLLVLQPSNGTEAVHVVSETVDAPAYQTEVNRDIYIEQTYCLMPYPFIIAFIFI